MSPTGVIPSNEIPPILVHLLNSGFLETVELKYFLKEGENREKEIVGFPNIFIFIFEIESYLKIYKKQPTNFIIRNSHILFDYLSLKIEADFFYLYSF